MADICFYLLILVHMVMTVKIRKQMKSKTIKWYAAIPIVFFFASGLIGFRLFGDSGDMGFLNFVLGGSCIGSFLCHWIGSRLV
jgi:hypothetical protein